jgi:hypothetical protein
VKAGLKPDSQRYFDYIMRQMITTPLTKELQLGAATWLMYLMDQNGIVK